ncbi:recombinase family protein [Alkalimonas sp. MEB108]|uniref:Recombinase family protein n=1 Tax=Alkalimonas cellulosilytica TaxID=3058395 RepID=A0ABU7J7B7_9GAMM|nr:recombinase family protein [Alkalimonas sp. MEB108]MEE2002426.1 recombinase family protein [Alkalimonas sp. MEB108]
MTRLERQQTLDAVKDIVKNYGRFSPPSYKRAAAMLNAQNLKTAWGNDWTPQRLLRFLQRQGYSGLHGVQAELNGRPKKLGQGFLEVTTRQKKGVLLPVRAVRNKYF